MARNSNPFVAGDPPSKTDTINYVIAVLEALRWIDYSGEAAGGPITKDAHFGIWLILQGAVSALEEINGRGDE